MLTQPPQLHQLQQVQGVTRNAALTGKKTGSMRKSTVKKLIIVQKSGINTVILILQAHTSEGKEHPFQKQLQAMSVFNTAFVK